MKRKTYDIWVIQQYTGSQYKWEDVCAEETFSEACQRAKEYRENQPEYPVRIKLKRELNPMHKKIKRNVYTINLPGDLADTIEELAQHAITEARERARLYCMPCEWRSKHIAGEVGDWEVTFRVTRLHY